jgi:hypothetical protein
MASRVELLVASRVELRRPPDAEDPERIGGAAARHLFTVACGLDSMAIGEGQIVARLGRSRCSALMATKNGGN